MGTQIAAEDLTWLLMDRPNNLMQVNGLMGFDELPDFETFRDLIMERMVGKYRILSQVAVERDGVWMWEDDPDFTIDRHVRRVVLDDAGIEAVNAYVSDQFSVPFDRSHPLWELNLVSGPDDDGKGGYLYSRFHHGIGDGIRLVQMLIGTCDPADGATPTAVGRNTAGEHHHPLERVLHVVEHAVTDTLDYVGHAGQAAAAAGRSLVSTTNPLDLAHHVGHALDLVRHPVKLIDALTGIASVDNEVANSWREIGRMLLSDGHDAEAWSGHTGVDKSVAWIEGFPLDGIRAAAKARDATINDVLIAAVSLALTDYLDERGVSDVSDLSWMMPVSLQPIDGGLPAELGNHFVVVMLSMPLGIRDPGALVDELHQRTTRLKHSVEPLVAFGFQRVVAESPSAVARRVTDYFAGKTIGVLSNVPGPRVGLTMAGAPVRSILGWVPTSGDQPLGVCLFSYDGTVNVGVATDSRMIPDPLHLAELVERHLGALVDAPEDSAHSS
ncbi:MAG: WS/DGAT domain-containing protein [Ilumatobacter sp.]|uniref:WS/DGAT domain-containing protein n=1 Tax=Ilumatobacter sp. TaxID=1967498 RepID=UPI00262A41C4|nr:WS/DGAT domain-containing protein [Ilumatobacter sp.]MDJ0768309.1 WS/DGAT domain-containing protein [Ilumatobacter sp.]